MECPGCNQPLTLEDLFEGARRAVPAKKWLWFTCPACQRDQVALPGKGNLQIGQIDGFPGPCFMPHERIAAPGFRVTWKGDGGAMVSWQGRRKRLSGR
ncbi:MAG: hypothetical protein QF578_18780 [Alphaproteobacteria bacterium]|jgi:hypothetical protein|nr:hypothetical protein [Alphaproteobacteria bacterium]MDP6566881.1 hypothetical protein [Alphaproteobacteria bacterium]